MKRITAILAILGTMALSVSPALAGNKFHRAKPATLHYQTFPYRFGLPLS